MVEAPYPEVGDRVGVLRVEQRSLQHLGRALGSPRRRVWWLGWRVWGEGFGVEG
jgi:hypothetical protein